MRAEPARRRMVAFHDARVGTVKGAQYARMLFKMAFGRGKLVLLHQPLLLSKDGFDRPQQLTIREARICIAAVAKHARQVAYLLVRLAEPSNFGKHARPPTISAIKTKRLMNSP
jgi:hypothetical protein